MGHGSEVKAAGRMQGLLRGMWLAVVLGTLLWSSVVSSEPGRGRPDSSAGPRRAYAAVDVIMYQTSW